MNDFKTVAQNFKIKGEKKLHLLIWIAFTFNGWTEDAQLSHLRNYLTVEICSTVHVVKGVNKKSIRF